MQELQRQLNPAAKRVARPTSIVYSMPIASAFTESRRPVKWRLEISHAVWVEGVAILLICSIMAPGSIEFPDDLADGKGMSP